MDCNSEGSLSALKVDDTLESRLEAHGISRRNLRSIIHSVFSDENVLRLLASADQTVDDLELPGVRVTRSKKINHSFEDDSDPDISEFFQPPDCADHDLAFPPLTEETRNSTPNFDTSVTSDLDLNDNSITFSNAIDDIDWSEWLNGGDDVSIPQAQKENIVESDSDPDYNILADLEERDDEDYRDDRTTRISKKELKNLRKAKRKRKLCATSIQEESGASNRVIPSQKSSECDRKLLVVKGGLKRPTARDRIDFLRSIPGLTSRGEHLKSAEDLHTIALNKTQKETLRQQMQQHVQLLAQGFVIEKKESVANSKALLNDIEYFKSVSLEPERSAFNALNLSKALELIKEIENTTGDNFECQDGTEQSGPAQIIANSSVFMYKELLPDRLSVTERCQSGRSKFTYHEDCLIAHGFHEMQGHFRTVVDLIHELLLPCHLAKDISYRIKTVMQGRVKNSTTNPIFKLRSFGKLPEPCAKVRKIDSNITVKPIEMVGQVPEWLTALKSKKAVNISTDGEFCLKKKRPCHSEHSISNLEETNSDVVTVTWNRDMDMKILSECQLSGGLTKKVLASLRSHFPMRTNKQIRQRFQKLMEFYCTSLEQTR